MAATGHVITRAIPPCRCHPCGRHQCLPLDVAAWRSHRPPPSSSRYHTPISIGHGRHLHAVHLFSLPCHLFHQPIHRRLLHDRHRPSPMPSSVEEVTIAIPVGRLLPRPPLSATHRRTPSLAGHACASDIHHHPLLAARRRHPHVVADQHLPTGCCSSPSPPPLKPPPPFLSSSSPMPTPATMLPFSLHLLQAAAPPITDETSSFGPSSSPPSTVPPHPPQAPCQHTHDYCHHGHHLPHLRCHTSMSRVIATISTTFLHFHHPQALHCAPQAVLPPSLIISLLP